MEKVTRNRRWLRAPQGRGPRIALLCVPLFALPFIYLVGGEMRYHGWEPSLLSVALLTPLVLSLAFAFTGLLAWVSGD